MSQKMMNLRTLRGTAHAIAALAVVAAAPLAASMPVSLRLTLMSADRHDEALSRGFISVLEHYEGFLLAGEPMPFARDALSRCLKLVEKAACTRTAIVRQAIDQDQPPVVVIVTRVGRDRYRWQCSGAGDQPWSPARQDVTLDLKQAMFGTPEVRVQARRRAVDCIMAAASEAKGRVRVPQD
jgi:hypothetical protein